MGCDRLPHDVRGGYLPPDVEEGCRGRRGPSPGSGGSASSAITVGVTNVRFCFQTKPTRSVWSGCGAPTEIRRRDANCGTVVPSQVSLLYVEVWTHIDVVVRVTVLSRVNDEEHLRVPSRSQDGLEGL